MDDDRSCNLEGICVVLIKMVNGMVRELREMRYVLQLKKNLIFVGTLEALALEISVRDGILKMTRCSMVVLNGV